MNDPAPPANRNRRGTGRPPRRSLALLTAGVLAAALAVAGCSNSGTEASSSTTEQQQQHTKEAPGRSDTGAGEARAGEAAGSAADSKATGKPGERDGSAEQQPPEIAADHVVRKAQLTVRVKDVPSALDDTRTTVEAAGGYIGDETTDRDGRSHERSRLVLRIPQEKYADVLADLSGGGKLIERKVSADDVSDQVVDVESRIASQKASVERVRDLMDEATELSDIVSLEGQLSTRQAELESLQARQASLKDRTAMATITLVLSETEVKKERDDETGFADALGGGWDAFITTLRWIAVVVGATLPFLAALAALLLVWRLVRHRLPQGFRRTPRPAGVPDGPSGGHAPAPAEAKSD
ncbi:hypothetical protein DB35_05040 [Streptomyces abyssalis]|uniref:DUF4349 domain-containing protein n=1 Tax=Streptomyces abyssalis TaxID=933944 RepID=A0A1E7JQM7_9ACTN|nr:DUF4349 domain-containing protein [Streptomyces abyssalis]OEU90545.1 hypothetical protein AN215_14115 [Streptomyces abyssalis]OEU95284.1 hypothetical protein DB35_05040 [Streptomyces abyssalis]